MILKKNKIRKPTKKEYQNYNGMHCSKLWKETGEKWNCPICKRSKKQIMRWGERKGPTMSKIYGKIGFTCSLHKSKLLGYLIICGGCTALQNRLRKNLKLKKDHIFEISFLQSTIKKAKKNGGIILKNKYEKQK